MLLLVVENKITGGVCQSTANNKYVKVYNKNKESPNLKCWDINNLYGWAMLQKLPSNEFKWVEDISKFGESFIKSYNKESDKGYFLEVDIQYPENLHNLYNDLPFITERKKIEELKKLIVTLHGKTEYVIHIKNLNHEFVLKKVLKLWQMQNL